MSCWVIVLPPSVTFPARALTQTARARLRRSRAAVVEEPVVLDGDHGVDQDLGRLRELDRPIVLARLVRAAGQHLALERRARGLLAVARHAGDAVPAHLESDARRLLAKVDVPDAARAAVLPGRGRRRLRLGVAEAGEGGGQIDGAHADAGFERLTRGMDEHGALCLGAPKPGQLHRRVGDERHRREEDDSGHSQADDGKLPRVERLHHGAENSQSPCQKVPVPTGR